MVDMDTLIHYIRVFSDLTAQLRYATQKRVLLEVALIKLCRPAMETRQDARLDRIRAVEKSLIEGWGCGEAASRSTEGGGYHRRHSRKTPASQGAKRRREGGQRLPSCPQ